LQRLLNVVVMENIVRVSVLVAGLCLVAGTPIPQDEDRLISFAITTETPTTTLQGLLQAHQNISLVCQSMIPAHEGAQPQDSTAPYKVNVSTTTVALRGVVSVQFSGLTDEQFRGLYVQARTEQNEPVGQFLPSLDEHVRLSSCGRGQDNAVSYISYQPISQFEFQWVAPDEPTAVTFTATIVESYSKFWVGAKSDTVVVA